MAKLTWDASGSRLYETGVDHGVLFVQSGSGTYGKGVVWNGLVSVSESPEGAEPNDIYADNIKYLTLMSAETFKASIEAYTYPVEFEACDGSLELVAGSGVYVSQQTRTPFALSYRTKVGNDVNPELGYKIHIIYGCLASPSERSHETINDSPEAVTMSWEVSSTPVESGLTNIKPISHLVIDSTKVTAEKLTALETKLYGSESAESALPMPADILAILNAQ